MSKPLRDKKNGQFTGSIGAGKTNIPTPAPKLTSPAIPIAAYPPLGEYEDNSGWVITTEIVPKSETPDFDQRARLLLGIEDQSAPVISYLQHGAGGTDYTPESWEEVTIECAGKN